MSRENERQDRRLLNVARALRESPNPKAFTMLRFVHGDDSFSNTVGSAADWCGTPACALGHYGSRTDLQKIVKIRPANVECGIRPRLV